VNGRLVGGFLVLIALVAGAAVYWTQVYAFYRPASFAPGAEILLTPIESRVPEPIIVADLEGTEKTSSPLGFKACFTTPLSQAMLSETYAAYPEATPTVAPAWFDCYDAAAIGQAIEAGEALAFLSEAEISPQIDRVVAVFPDGRAFAWHQVRPGVAEGLLPTEAEE
jgi:hypothetical protein